MKSSQQEYSFSRLQFGLQSYNWLASNVLDGEMTNSSTRDKRNRAKPPRGINKGAWALCVCVSVALLDTMFTSENCFLDCTRPAESSHGAALKASV